MQKGRLTTATIFIATGETTAVYRGLDEVPPALRKRLVKSTDGPNAATVLIADARGVQELLRDYVEAPKRRRMGLVRSWWNRVWGWFF
jgi:hypothetical protein